MSKLYQSRFLARLSIDTCKNMIVLCVEIEIKWCVLAWSRLAETKKEKKINKVLLDWDKEPGGLVL